MCRLRFVGPQLTFFYAFMALSYTLQRASPFPLTHAFFQTGQPAENPAQNAHIHASILHTYSKAQKNRVWVTCQKPGRNPLETRFQPNAGMPATCCKQTGGQQSAPTCRPGNAKHGFRKPFNSFSHFFQLSGFMYPPVRQEDAGICFKKSVRPLPQAETTRF